MFSLRTQLKVDCYTETNEPPITLYHSEGNPSGPGALFDFFISLTDAFSFVDLIAQNFPDHHGINISCVFSVSGWQDRQNTSLTKWPLSALIYEFHSREN